MVEIVRIPDGITIEGLFRADSVTVVAALTVDALREAGSPRTTSWSVPSTARRRKVQTGGLPNELAPGRLPPNVDTAAFELSDGSLGTLYHPYGAADWALRLDTIIPKEQPGSMPERLALQRRIVRALLSYPGAVRVTVTMQSTGANCIPKVPVAMMRTYVVSTTETEVAESYEIPDAFWESGWAAIEWVGKHAMLERAMHTASTTDYLREVIPHQWALARAARPGLCDYGVPVVWPEEEEVYSAGAPALNLVGYEDATATVELTCALRPPQHVQGWEIFNLYGLRESGALPDGRPVKGIRVVFLHEAMARSERRPLLDIGVRVLYYDAAGHLDELTT